MRRTARFTTLIAACLTAATACTTVSQTEPVDIDIAVGDVTDTSAIVWLRAPAHRRVSLRLSAPGFERVIDVSIDPGADDTAKIDARELPAGTRINVEVRAAATAANATFTTAPGADVAAAVTFLAGGDLAGQNVCRDATLGFPIFDAVANINADFFIGLGDMIYADGECLEVGRHGNRQTGGTLAPATTLPGYRAHWRYSYGDPAFRRLRRRMAYFAVWDDHEVVNDFGPQTTDLMTLGRRALIEQNPLRVPADDRKRLYRRVRWGRHLEIYFLDTRQYRDDNDSPDTAGKTLLGDAQTEWLVSSFAASNATWQVVVSSVPLAIPTGWPPDGGRDGWASGDGASGFERGLIELLGALRATGRRNWLWLSADVHFATAFRFRPFADDSEFVFHELVTGPLSAGLFPDRKVDATLNPKRLFFHGPDEANPDVDYDQARAYHNIAAIRIDERGTLAAEVIDSYGRVVGRITIRPLAQTVAARQ